MPWEETENEIRNRVRDPDGFQDGSFRRVPLKPAKPRVFAIMGRLEGQDTMTIQALRFPKEDDWTVAKARAWQTEHNVKELEMDIGLEEKAVTKTEGGTEFVASDYADVPDPQSPNLWKLRLAEGSSGNFKVAQVARAITALQPGGFRGQQVDLGTRKAEVIGKINAAIGKIEGVDDAQKKNLRDRLDAVKAKVKSLDEKNCDEGHGPMPVMAYGGATSFAAIDAWKGAMQSRMNLDELYSQFRAVQDNIVADDEMSDSDKADAVEKAASDFRSRVAKSATAMAMGTREEEQAEEEKEELDEKEGKRLNRSWVDQVKSAVATLTKLLGWASYHDDDENKGGDGDEERMKPTKRLMMEKAESSFKVFRDKAGALRWLAFSSNAFKDREGEIFTTKALKEAVAEADKSGERGPLRLYHVPGADIGTCDFQDVVGRFLVESGTFDDTARGRKAAEYFEEAEDEHGVSIGYRYEKADRGDKVYDWLQFIERSVAPKAAVANSWTMFKTIGGKVEEKKKAFLDKVLGEDLAKEVIMTAETQTKELEGEVAFKALGEKAQGLVDAIASVSDPAVKAQLETALQGLQTALLEKGKEEAVSDAEEDSADGSDAPVALEQLKGVVVEAIKPLAETITGLQSQLTELQTGQKEQGEKITAQETALAALQKSDDEKVVNLFYPRARSVGQAASTSADTIVDKDSELGKALEGAGDGDGHPAKPYVEDLITVLGGAKSG